VTAGIAAERLVLGALADDKVALALVRDDIGARHDLGEFEGSLVGQLPVVTAREANVALVGGPLGVTANGFTGGLWEPMAPTTVTKAGVVSVTATQYIDDALVAWSTDSKECHLVHYATGKESVRRYGCDDARIAIDPLSRRGMLVSVQEGNVVRTPIFVNVEGELLTQQPVAEQATSPRVVFDGTRIWMTYLDARGDVVVGFVDAGGRLVARALEGTQPEVDAYELVVCGGAPWVVAITDQGVTAQRVCALDPTGSPG
jgi:hypothetical protein